MRIAVLSDIHGNWTALEAAIADLRVTAPDAVLFGGDLADGGSSPAEVVDCVRERGWPGVLGNTDEMLIRPDSLERFASLSKSPPQLWQHVRAIAAATREVLGEDRLAWIAQLPAMAKLPGIAVVHAQPGDCWRAPAADASDELLEKIYEPLREPVVAWGHTHLPSIRKLAAPQWLVNSGSIGLPYDGDPRASYLLLEDEVPTIRRVPYDVERELERLTASGLPGAAWTAKMLRASAPQMP